jgi:TPR repeat protein
MQSAKGVQQDYAEAMKWFQKAADQGNAIAEADVGVMYDNGQGVQRDYAEAMKWYRKAADQGNAIGQNNIGYMYEIGKGVQQDYAEAMKWFQKAADQGYAVAQYKIGSMYQLGQGAEGDYAKAAKWYRKAADQGYAEAQRKLKPAPSLVSPSATSSTTLTLPPEDKDMQDAYCKKHWTKRDVLDEQMYRYCMTEQDIGYYKLMKLAKANSSAPWIQDVIDHIFKDYTSGGLRNDVMVAFSLGEQLDACDDLVFASKKSTFDKDKYELCNSVYGLDSAFHLNFTMIKYCYEN